MLELMEFQTLRPEVGKYLGREEPSGGLSNHPIGAPSCTSEARWCGHCASPDVDIFKQLEFPFFPAPQPHPHPSQQMDNRKQPKLLNFSLIFPSLAN